MRLRFFSMILLASTALSGFSHAANPIDESLKELPGVWKWTYKDGQVFTHKMTASHTWNPNLNKKSHGKWKVEGEKVMFTFPDGGVEWMLLPIDPKGTKGASTRGAQFTAVRESTADRP